MKFQPESLTGLNAVQAYTPDELRIAGQPWRQSVLVPAQGEVRPWTVDAFDALTPAHFEALLDLNPELVVFGSGPRLRFVPPAMYRSLIERGVGLETMDTQAACRTYNILVSEGRKAVGAFLLERSSDAA